MFSGRYSRRSFLTVAGGMAVTSFAPRSARAQVSANDKINIAVIGNGGMGSRHIEALCDNPNCNILALCDVVKTRYTQMQGIVEQKTGKKPAQKTLKERRTEKRAAARHTRTLDV